ncbi:MAG TPA: homoserine kinase [Sporichthyaceae bacterium]
MQVRESAVAVRVPATSANLGPGFDAFGLALGLYDEVTVRAMDFGVSIEILGEGAQTLPRDESHLLVRSARACLDRLGVGHIGLQVSCTNRIPHGRGLGSSSAAIVAGVTAARALVPDGEKLLDDDALLALACELEGHPDNVAACLRGGFTVAWTGGDGPHVISLTPDERIHPVVFIPAAELSTVRARGLLPDKVPHADAASNAARAGLLVVALTSDPSLLLVATEDRLHQDYRRLAMPLSLQLMESLRAQGVAATISGAGPAVLALTDMAGVYRVGAAAGPGWRAERLAVDTVGATVRAA